MSCSSSLRRALFFLVLGAAGARAAVSYSPIADVNAVVTGVRSDSATTDSVVLTAEYATNGTQYAALYQGSLAGAVSAPSSSWHAFLPVFEGQTVTAATFYGPNTARYLPSIGVGNVIAVGSYKYAESPSGPATDHGMLYEGPVDGSGAWRQIDATSLVPEGDTLLDTIAHSNMGNLVVGNYDTQLDEGRAFIYDRVADTWRDLNPGNTESVTAYGIWQNGGPESTSYTIAGGQGNLGPGELDQGYLVDYDSATRALTNYRVYHYNNQPEAAQLAHFDGITGTAAGYSITGTASAGLGVKGFFATVARNPDGTFSEATWTDVIYPGSSDTTGNTVVENKVLGIFGAGDETQSYLATIPATRYAVAVRAAKSGARAVFTVRNTGNVATTFRLRAKTTAASSPAGAAKAYVVTYTLNGKSATKGVTTGAATVSLATGASARVVETAKAKGKVPARHTIRTTLTASRQGDSSVKDSAAATIVLPANK